MFSLPCIPSRLLSSILPHCARVLRRSCSRHAHPWKLLWESLSQGYRGCCLGDFGNRSLCSLCRLCLPSAGIMHHHIQHCFVVLNLAHWSFGNRRERERVSTGLGDQSSLQQSTGDPGPQPPLTCQIRSVLQSLLRRLSLRDSPDPPVVSFPPLLRLWTGWEEPSFRQESV